MADPKLYRHQVAWTRAIGKAFAHNKAVMAQAPTGMGKTVCLAFMAKKIAAAGGTVIIAVHRQEIFLQTSEHLLNFGLQHDLLGSSQVVQMALLAAAHRGELLSKSSGITLASLPTLAKRHRLPRAKYLFIDEAHHAAADTWASLINTYKRSGVRIVGVTATPERHDGKPLLGLFDDLVMGPSMRDLIVNGFLAPYEVMEPRQQIDRNGLKLVHGEFVAAEMNPRARKIVGDAIEQYRKHLDGDKCLVFCPSVEEAELTAQNFREAGYRAASVDGRMKEVERNKRIRDLGNHTLQLLTSCNILSEGLDVPSVSGMVHLRPTYSRGRWMQDVGRTIRFKPGKKAKIIDHAGNNKFHGNPMDITEFAFAGRERRERGEADEPVTFTIINCAGCYMPHESTLPKCPFCGHVREARGGPSYKKEEGDLYAEVRADDDELDAIKEAHRAFNSGGLHKELEEIAARYNLTDEWVEMMNDRGKWWETPLGKTDVIVH